MPGRLLCAVGAAALLPGAVCHGQLSIGTSFVGSTFSASGFIPPDTMGAIGPDHYIELINGRYAAFLKSNGAELESSSLNAFWNAAGAAPAGNSFDPRVLYDHDSGRWFAVSVDNAQGPNNFLVAVSDTSDPTDGWTGFKIDADSDNAQWADFPTVGINADALCVSANMFGSSFRVNILVLPKADLLLPVPTVANATLLESFTSTQVGSALQPVIDFDGDDPLALPILSRYSSSSLRRMTMLGPMTSPALSIGPLIGTTSFGTPPDADQPPMPFPKQDIDTGDSRFSGNVILRNGILWAVQTINSGGRAAVRFFKINAATDAMLHEDVISDPQLAFYYPSIAVNELGDLVIGFSGSSSTQAVACYAAAGLTSGGATTLFAPVRIQNGFNDYEIIDGSGRNRWGDYSATTLDPVDSTRFWTAQEFVIGEDEWATKITELILPHAAPNNDCANALPITGAQTPFTTLNTTTDGLDTSCDGGPEEPIDNDIWFLYTATCDGTATFSTCNNADFDTRIAVYDDVPCPPSVPLGCSDDAAECGPTSSASVAVLEGTTYLVRIGGGNGESGSGVLTVTCAPSTPPPNDNCVNATVVTNGTTPFTTLGATDDGLPFVCDAQAITPDKDVWFTWTATCTDVATISVCNEANFNTALAVYFPGACPPSSPVACNVNAEKCGLTSEVEVSVFEGIPYTIRIGGISGGTGSGNLTISCGPPCPWDCDGSGDGNANVSDLLALLGQYDPAAPNTCTGGSCDYDGNGCVDVVDLLMLLAHYTTDPGGAGCP